MRKFKIDRAPLEDGLYLYDKSSIEIQEGLTVLVGCNGSGKTTLLNCIESCLKDEGIPVLKYNNQDNNGSGAKVNALLRNDIMAFAAPMLLSEGENIVVNITYVVRDIEKFVSGKGNTDNNFTKLVKLLQKDGQDGEQAEQKKEPEEYWILLDAIDSGLSLDNIQEVKTYVFDKVIEDIKKKGKRVYIVVSANEYEMCIDSACFDVQAGKYVDIQSYEDYRKLIVKSRAKKERYHKKHKQGEEESNE